MNIWLAWTIYVAPYVLLIYVIYRNDQRTTRQPSRYVVPSADESHRHQVTGSDLTPEELAAAIQRYIRSRDER
jgi:hypothetical protein